MTLKWMQLTLFTGLLVKAEDNGANPSLPEAVWIGAGSGVVQDWCKIWAIKLFSITGNDFKIIDLFIAVSLAFELGK